MKFISVKNTTDSLNIVPILNTCKWDWKFEKRKSFGEHYTAPIGYTYVIVTIYIENESNQLVSTSVRDWNFIANGIVYDYDSITWDDEINHISIDVCKGGKFTTKIVYLVTDNIEYASLYYSECNAPQMELIEYFNLLDDSLDNSNSSIIIMYIRAMILFCIVLMLSSQCGKLLTV